ncbi:potassium-transporting ATPase subunit KdpC [Ancylobacter dichloromethanicus]|uniref:Potassium-transporting ATPase KdpC subunit n=1 Tax=Ancylobacter dichloromethanicus TaxID=518825 RepID=A0A9W6MY35_9HYPH|nr:potassium-transporting ATPase subunit KdpC [Ancylobacter dichloromethanicus]MBS7554113.1 potassium-transporting ATPase subunit KdpC [Ancylobacter dichloromethanicus]GLK71229.1 potassium-transporting ATPase KdpC subunit [Ancylobacter dichloromethanicus]
MISTLRPALVLLALFTALTGLAYPLAVTGLAQLALPEAANGSPVVVGGRVVGSSLIGQSFTSKRYFHGRPSATTGADPADPAKSIEDPYNAASSTGSNLGPSSAALAEAVKARVAALGGGPVPADLVTASASGLDPDISPAAAALQVSRVASARGLPEDEVRALVNGSTMGRRFGLLGEPRVNVLALNLALDALNR